MRKILIVEDDKFLGSAYRVKLTKSGFEVQIATDGNEAFSVLKTYVPDIILLDLIMPGKDGFTVLAELKADLTLKNIPVIVASNLGQKEDIEKSRQLGAADFIVKSDLSLESIINKVNAILDSHDVATVAPVQAALSTPVTVSPIPVTSSPANPSPTPSPSGQTAGQSGSTDDINSNPPQSPPPAASKV